MVRTTSSHSRGNFVYLLVGLLILFIALPLFEETSEKGRPFANHVFLGVVMIFGVWSLVRHRILFKVTVVLIAMAVVSSGLGFALGIAALRYCALGLAFVFFLLCIGIASHEVLFTKGVDANKIAGAICIYLLLGVTWAFFYFFVHATALNAFSGIAPGPAEEPLTGFVYFSFVTLTTLGYGDITPLSPIARSLATLEAIFGQFYIAVLVASLVGIHISSRGESERNGRTTIDR